MKNNIIKIMLILIMLLGTAFSISNFLSVEVHAVERISTWIYLNGEIHCMGHGNECDPFAFDPGG